MHAYTRTVEPQECDFAVIRNRKGAKKMCGVRGIRVYLIDKLKISEVGDKREYRIYRNSIGDRKKISNKI